MELRSVITEDGTLFLARDDIVAVLRAEANRFLAHIDGHAERNEFMEALQDQRSAATLQDAAQRLEDMEMASNN